VKFVLTSLALSLGLAGASVLCVAQPREPRVMLRESAEVRGAIIHLSDLLPADAPAALRTRAAAVALGRAPQPGSLRVLRAPQLARRLAEKTNLLDRLSLPAQITVRRTGWPIQRQNVRNAVEHFLQDKGWDRDGHLDMTELEWAGDFAALKPNPALEVAGAAWDSLRPVLQLRLRCAEPALCSSFLVQLPVPQSQEALWRRRLEEHSAFAENRGAPQTPKAKAIAGPPLTQPGDAATLILQSGAISISLPVVCLQRGALRQEIRARDASSRRIFQAQVIGTDLLEVKF
jgi:Chaperone for flagella basal body P-ring formation